MAQQHAERPLTPKQTAFVAEYVIDRNATQAAIRAGYSAGVANRTGARLMTNAVIARAVAEREQTLADRLGITHEYVLRSLHAVAERAMQAKAVYDHEGNPTGAYVFDGKTANKSLELLGKHLGMWPRESGISVSGEQVIVNFGTLGPPA